MRQQLEKMIYKLLTDILSLVLLVFSLNLIVDAIVPNLFAAYLSFTKIILILFAILSLIVWLGKRNNITFEFSSEKGLRKNKTILFLLLVSFVLIINSLRSLGFAETIIFSLAVFVILLFFYKTFLLPDNNLTR